MIHLNLSFNNCKKNQDAANKLLNSHKFEIGFFVSLLKPEEFQAMKGGSDISDTELMTALNGQAGDIERQLKVGQVDSYKKCVASQSEFLIVKEKSDNLKTTNPHQYRASRSNKNQMIYIAALGQELLSEELIGYLKSEKIIPKVAEFKQALINSTNFLEKMEGATLEECVVDYQGVIDEMNVMIASLF